MADGAESPDGFPMSRGSIPDMGPLGCGVKVQNAVHELGP